MSAITNYLRQQNINPIYDRDVNQYVSEFETVEVFDDSGSMVTAMGPGYGDVSRWGYLKNQAHQELVLANKLDSNGVDVCFLNRSVEGNSGLTSGKSRSGMTTLKDDGTLADRVHQLFQAEPSPYASTPTIEKLDQITSEIRPVLGERKVQIRVHTDGVPNGGIGKLDTWLQQKYMKDQQLMDRVALTFNLCVGHSTPGDHEVVKHYKDVVDPLMGKNGKPLMVDVILPFQSAKHSAESANRGFKYNEQEHFLKSFLGASNPAFDKIGEEGGTKVNTTQNVVLTENVQLQMPQGCGCRIM